jgi:hypothetical protein
LKSIKYSKQANLKAKIVKYVFEALEWKMVSIHEIMMEHNALCEQLAETQRGVEMFRTKGYSP